MCTVREFYYPSSDGVSRVYAREWRPEGAARAVLQLAHGICEHLGRYDDFARFMAGNGVLVVANDHLGHGRTAATAADRGFFAARDGWTHVVDDVESLRRQTAEAHPGLPYFLLGHSMGSFVVRTYLIRYPGRLSGALISGTGQQAPALVTAGLALTDVIRLFRGPRRRSTVVNNMAFGAYNRNFEPKRTASDWLTRDTQIVDAHLRDELCGFIPTVSLYHDMLSGVRLISRLENVRRMDVNTPVLFFSGAMDPVGEETRGVRRAVENFKKAGCRDVTVKFYEGGRHEMLNEINRAEVYADVLAWIDSKLPAAAR
jgi:alpha-beta hydrolase superfamily lysophospholipase